MTPIQLHTDATPNGHKASIMLEEVGLPYTVRHVDIERGDQASPAFRALSPNGKIPVIVDTDRGRTLFESGAILHYLAERSGQLLPRDEDERLDTLAWSFLQAAHIGPTLGQLWHFKIFASEPIPAAIDRFEREAARLFRVLDGRLAESAHLGGDAFGIADVMTWPWIRSGIQVLGLSLDDTLHLQRWYAAIEARPAVRRGLRVPVSADAHNTA